MPKSRLNYSKSKLLIIVFISVISLSLLVVFYAIAVSTKQLVEDQFYQYKTDVGDSTSKAYKKLESECIPHISYYKGFLDSSSFSPLAENFLNSCPFIDTIEFYNIEPRNRFYSRGIKIPNLNFEIDQAVKYRRKSAGGPVSLYRPTDLKPIPKKLIAKCKRSLYYFAELLADYDSTRSITKPELFKYFYKISDFEISYLSVPDLKQLKYHRELMFNRHDTKVHTSRQDLVFFQLKPEKLTIVNCHPRLYEKIFIRPLMFDSLNTEYDHNYLTTSVALPRVFAEYRLYFLSSKKFLMAEELRLMLPKAIFFSGFYVLVIMVSLLIYRSMNINKKLFKLQYDFINNFTHEFKTPVSVIKIAGNNIKSGEVMFDHELIRYGNILEEEADKLHDLMNRLLSFTQLENRSIPIKIESIDIKEFCQEFVQACQIKYPDFQIVLEIGNISHIAADKVLLNSIFTNLADNAYKYSYPKRKHLQIVIVKMRKWIFIHFVDQGVGIPNKELKNIFKKFYKVENEFNQNGSIGIGLAFCLEIIHYMGGELSVISEVAKGTEFTVKLPLFDKHGK